MMELLLAAILLIAFFIVLFLFRSPINKLSKEADKFMDVVSHEHKVYCAKKLAKLAKEIEELDKIVTLEDIQRLKESKRRATIAKKDN